MLYSYNQCIEKFGSKYLVKKAVEEGKLFRKEKGVYSDEKYVSSLEIISMKYPNAIFTLNSAFYYYDLTDTIPQHYYLATGRGAAKIQDKRVIQIFENSDVLELGITYLEREGCRIKIYDRERMLVELLRNKNKLSFNYYKEILLNYRKIIEDLDMQVIQDYVYAVPKSEMIMKTMQLEVL